MTEFMDILNGFRDRNVYQCFTDFPEDCVAIEESIKMMADLTSFVSKAGKDYLGNPQFQANHILFSRNFELICSSYYHVVKGEYGTSKVLMRMIIENAFLMRYFVNNINEARLWYSSGKNFKPSRIRKAIFKGKLKRDFGVFYSRLCDYAHPNIRGCLEHIVERPNPYGIILIRNFPLYSRTYASDCIGVLAFLIKESIQSILLTFENYIVKDKNLITLLQNLEIKLDKVIERREQNIEFMRRLQECIINCIFLEKIIANRSKI